jgi:sarcosine oxidase subunit gamma
MAKGTGLDLHPRAFKAGQCAQTAMAQANMTLDQTDDAPSYDLYILDSFADYLWSWIELAGADLDIAVVE